jgi:hypothetical protein
VSPHEPGKLRPRDLGPSGALGAGVRPLVSQLQFRVGAVGKQKTSELACRTHSCRKNERNRGEHPRRCPRFGNAIRTPRRAWAAWLGWSDLRPAEVSLGCLPEWSVLHSLARGHSAGWRRADSFGRLAVAAARTRGLSLNVEKMVSQCHPMSPENSGRGTLVPRGLFCPTRV